MRALFEKFLYRSGVHQAVGLRYAGRGVNFMMHSIVDDAEPYLAEPTRCTVAVLERLLEHLRASEIDIVTPDAAFERLDDPTAKRFATLTFDDGYRDNLTHALPVLERYGAPATIFVTTGMIERADDAWWIGLVEWLKACDWITVEGFGKRPTATLPEKIATRIDLTNWVQGDVQRLEALQRAMKADGISISGLVDQQALSRDELRTLADHSLITIGGHTVSHPWLASLPEDEASREISDNRRYLRELTQQDVDHFAYPFGSPVACAEREMGLVAEAGFSSAFTCRHGCMFPLHRDLRYAWPREGVHWYENEASIVCKSVGGQRLFRNLKLKRPWRSPIATMAAD
ncbi:MAG: polysaccharide deacetylase family protein [Geminicoccaceae bacterium]